MRCIERQFALRQLQDVVNCLPLFSCALSQPHDIRRFKFPRRRRESAHARYVIVWLRNHPQVGQHIAHQRMIQDREVADHERYLASRQFFHQKISMRMLPVQHRKILPSPARPVAPFNFSRHPTRFVLLACKLDNPDPFTFRFARMQDFFRKVRARFVMRNRLRRHTQNVGRRSVIFLQQDAQFCGVFALFPSRKPLQKQFEASERCAAKAVNCLIVVSHDHNVSWRSRDQLKQSQLRDVGILKFIHQDVPISPLEPFAQRRVLFQQLHGFRHQSIDCDGILFT